MTVGIEVGKRFFCKTLAAAMSVEQGRLVSLLLREAFGGSVESVGTYLIKQGPQILPVITNNLNIQAGTVTPSVSYDLVPGGTLLPLFVRR